MDQSINGLLNKGVRSFFVHLRTALIISRETRTVISSLLKVDRDLPKTLSGELRRKHVIRSQPFMIFIIFSIVSTPYITWRLFFLVHVGKRREAEE